MSSTYYHRHSLAFLIIVLGNYPFEFVSAEIFLGNFDTDTNTVHIGIGLGVLALFFGLSFVGYNYCCRAFAPEASIRPFHRQMGRAGLDPGLIETFPVFPYSQVEANRPGKEPLECAVCLEEFDTADKLRLLPKCSHVFHVECVDMWLLSHSTCPLCRADLVIQPDMPGLEIVGLAYVPGDRANEVVDEVVIEIREEIVEGGLRKNRKCYSTGNLAKMERVDQNWERYTLKLPEDVKNDIILGRKFTRCTSSRQFS